MLAAKLLVDQNTPKVPIIELDSVTSEVISNPKDSGLTHPSGKAVVMPPTHPKPAPFQGIHLAILRVAHGKVRRKTRE